MAKKRQKSNLCKIVYFDEDSVTDYMQIVAGGRLEKATELLNETNDKGETGIEAKASVGVGGFLKALIGFETSVAVGASLETSFNTNSMVKNIVKNTMLSDFIDVLENGTTGKEKSKSSNEATRKFTGYTVSAPKDSLSYIALISPYLSMLKGGAGVPAGEFNIAIEKIDNTIKSAKGYYDFVGDNGKEKLSFALI